MSTTLKDQILEFFEADDVSSPMPGMKDFKSVKTSDGRIHKQKRLLLGNLREMFKRFKEINPDAKVGISKFASLRPEYCILAGSSGTHTVCVCVIL